MADKEIAVVNQSSSGLTQRQNGGGAPQQQRPLSVDMTVADSVEGEAAKALIQARFVMAASRPRNMNRARDSIVDACSRPRFAASAQYALPTGTDKATGKRTFATGPSVSFSRHCFQSLGNMLSQVTVKLDTPLQRIVVVRVTDLESNACYEEEVVVEKTTERSYVKEGAEVLGKRKNSCGKEVFIVRANEGEVRMKEKANVAKTERTLVLRLVPADITEEAMEVIEETLRTEEDKAAAPDIAARCVAAYSAKGISRSELERYLGHAIASTTKGELRILASLLAEIREGMTTWEEKLHEAGLEPVAPPEASRREAPEQRTEQPAAQAQTQGTHTADYAADEAAYKAACDSAPDAASIAKLHAGWLAKFKGAKVLAQRTDTATAALARFFEGDLERAAAYLSGRRTAQQ